jgi:hypothetical protein
MPQAQLICFSYEHGSDLVRIQAYVDDAVQVAAATLYDPPEFGSAACETFVLWDDPITSKNAPTQEDIDQMLPWITDWMAIPPISFDD